MQTLLKNLISFQTDKNHSQEIKKCFSFVISWLKSKGLKVKTYSLNDKPSLVAAKNLKKKYQFILNGHLDVVPASYKDKDAFTPKIKDNRLYGRGASDMKGTVAVLMTLMADKQIQKTDTALMLTTDEEIGGFAGVRYLVEEEGYRCDCVIIPDGGDNWHLVLGEKGVLHLAIEAKGKATHGSRPWLGENAIEKLITVYQEIKSKMPKWQPNEYWHPTVNLGKVEGGEATNQVPSKAVFYLDFRYPKKQDREKIIKVITKAVKKQTGVSFKILVEGDPLINNSNNFYLQKVKQLANQQGVKVNYSKAHGASDGRFFSAKNIPVVMFKPNCSQPHIDNEWIDLVDLERFKNFLKKYLLGF